MRVCALYGCRCVSDAISYGHYITVQMDQQRDMRVSEIMDPDLSDAVELTDIILIPGDRLVFQKEQPVAIGKIVNTLCILPQVFHHILRHGNGAKAV